MHEQGGGGRDQTHEGRSVEDAQADERGKALGPGVSKQGESDHDQACAHDRQSVARSEPGADEWAQHEGRQGFEGENPSGPEGRDAHGYEVGIEAVENGDVAEPEQGHQTQGHEGIREEGGVRGHCIFLIRLGMRSP